MSYRNPGWTAAALSAALLACSCSDDPGADPHDVDSDAQIDDADAHDADGVPDGDTGAVDAQDADSSDSTADADADVALDASDASDARADVTPPTGCVPSDAAPDPRDHLLGNGWVVTVDHALGSWSLTPPGALEPAVEAPPLCVDVDGTPRASVRIARGEPGVNALFGAFRIALERGASTLVWRDVGADPIAVVADASQVVMQLDAAEPVELRFVAVDDHVRVTVSPSSDVAAELVTRCRPDESFFGLGSQVTTLDLRGRTYPLWTQEQGNGKPENPGWPLQNDPEAAYAPMGVWHSTHGFSAVTDRDGYGELALCDGDDRVVLRGYPEGVSFTLVHGDSPAAQVEAVTSLIGRLPSPPPPWTFGPWNDAVGGPDRLYEVAEILRTEGIPSSAIWSEDWIGGAQGPFGFRLSYAWAWDPTRYPDLPGDIAFLHSRGFAFLAYFNTFVPSTTAMYAEGVEGGFLVEHPDGGPYLITDPASRQTGLVDLTDEGARAWFGGYMRTAAGDLGIDGWMVDFTEWMPVDGVLDDGDAWTYHNRWPLDFQRLVREVMEDVHADDPRGTNDWATFARSGWASTASGGAGALTPTMWGGDQETGWGHNDGYPSVIAIATHLGVSGVPIFGSDVAGYSSLAEPNTTKELFYRWSSMAAFMGLMRTHHGSDECGNWSFDRDAETIDHYRRWASVHTLLYPVFVDLLDQALDSGLPFVRHPWLVEPAFPALWQGQDYEFFLGDDILVAPVLAEAQSVRGVRLPGVGWWPLFGDAPIGDAADDDGVVRIDVDAPVTEVPVFVRPGSAVPLLPRVVDSFYGASAEGVTDLGTVGDDLAFALYPDGAGDVRLRRSGDVSLSATGVAGPRPFTGASLDGVAIDTCELQPAPCVAEDGAALVTSGDVGTVTLAGGGTIDVVAPDGVSVTVRVGGAAWGTLAEVPSPPDLDVVVPLPCEE